MRTRVSTLILKKIKTDRGFRLGLADALECSEQNIEKLALRKSLNLSHVDAIDYYKAMGLSDTQIVEAQKVSKSA